LAALVVELRLLVSAQAATITQQADRIGELERQAGSDSHNSSKPPSSDGLRKKPAPKSLRKTSGRRPGRAMGDPSGHLEQVANPDAIVNHPPSACDGCGNALSQVVSSGYRARQVFDLPEIVPEVTEHRLHQAHCGCGHVTAAVALFAPSISTGTVLDVLAGFQDRYRRAVLCGIAAHPYAGTGPRSKARALTAPRLPDLPKALRSGFRGSNTRPAHPRLTPVRGTASPGCGSGGGR
jgi:hypothetical protein